MIGQDLVACSQAVIWNTIILGDIFLAALLLAPFLTPAFFERVHFAAPLLLSMYIHTTDVQNT